MSTYLDILSETIRTNWNQPALTDFYLTEDGTAQDTSRGNHYTYGEMYAEIVRVADLLTSNGLQKGDHIAICGSNSSHWVIAYLAIAKMQGVSVTVMHSLQTDQIAQMVNFSDAKALFVDEDIWRELKDQSLPRAEHVIRLDDWSVLRGETIIKHQSSIINEECGFPHSAPDSLAMICFTSGSSGAPKGVMLPYRSVSNVTLNEINGFPASSNNNYVSFLPFSHMYGLMTDMIGQLALGKHIYTPHGMGSIKTLGLLSHVRPYAVVTIPEVLTQLYTKYKEQLPILFGSKCEQLYIGGSAISKEIIKGIVALRMPFSMGYGLSETCFLISYVQSKEYRYKSAGKICIGMTCHIAPNGEILVKGENVMLGYYKDPEATAQKIDKDGWLHTGDKGHLDEDGYLYVEGRLEQDIIVLPNGENIRPDNIESLINALPEVSESIVFARDGKLVARVVVPSSLPFREESEVGSLRRMILRQVNPQLPLFSQLYDVEITDQPLARTEKQTLKRYLYK